MSDTLEQVERTQSLAIQTSVLKAVAQIPAMTPRTGGMPKVVITGDIRLRVTESSAALRPMKGHYRIETESMQEPLHVHSSVFVQIFVVRDDLPIRDPALNNTSL